MTDKQLVVLAKEGHQEAVSEIYEKYLDPIYRYCYWQTNHSHEDAEDLTQEVFVEMAKSIASFKDTGQFKNWLYTIAKRRLSAWIKRKYQLPQSPLFDNITIAEKWIDPKQQSQSVNLVKSLLQKLSPPARDIIALRFLRNYTVQETAQTLHLTEANVKVITHRSIKKLRAIGLDVTTSTL